MGCLGLALSPMAAHFPSGKKPCFRTKTTRNNPGIVICSIQRNGIDEFHKASGVRMHSEADFGLNYAYLPDTNGTVIMQAVRSGRGPFIALRLG